MKEIIVLLGYNGAGKTTLVKKYTDQGYHRINRDEIGGKLSDLPNHARTAIDAGHEKLVLDNTYRNRESRKGIIELAKEKGFTIRCVHLTTSFEDAQINACRRMMQRTGGIMMPEDFKKSNDPNLFPPVALFTYRKEFEAPKLDEGFDAIENVPFVRVWGPEYVNKALILDYDDTLRTSNGPEKYPTKPEHITILPGRKEKIQEYKDKGYLVFGVSNQSGVAKKKLTAAEAQACFDHTNQLLGHNIEVLFCPHSVPPVNCYCRKPHPASGVYLIEKYKLEPKSCIMVGDQTTDKTFAARCGFKFIDQQVFFA